MTRPAPYAFTGLDRLFHERARLGIVTSLAGHPDGLAFAELKRLCGLTDGNLNRHLTALEDAGCVSTMKRMRAIYKAKGYSDAWIEKRVRGIAVREELTDEWNNRGIKDQGQYAILTAEISKAAFGLTPSEYKKLKGLNRENLRDQSDQSRELISSASG